MSTLSEPIEKRWRSARRFADVLEAEVKSWQHPFVAQVVSWYNFRRVFEDLEEQMLLAPAAWPYDKPPHVQCSSVEALAPCGGVLVSAANQKDFVNSEGKEEIPRMGDGPPGIDRRGRSLNGKASAPLITRLGESVFERGSHVVGSGVDDFLQESPPKCD